VKLIFKILAALWVVGLPIALLDGLHAGSSTRAWARQFDGGWQCVALLAVYYGPLLVLGHVVLRRRIARELNSPSIQRDMESIRRRLAGAIGEDPEREPVVSDRRK
jgi:hypothetical protein